MKIRLHKVNNRIRTTETQAFEDEDLCTESPTVLFGDELASIILWVVCVVRRFSVTPPVGVTGFPVSAGINVTSLEPCFS